MFGANIILWNPLDKASGGILRIDTGGYATCPSDGKESRPFAPASFLVNPYAQEKDSRIEWKQPYEQHSNLFAHLLIWETSCGRYRVLRAVCRVTGEITYGATGPRKHDLIGSSYSSLLRAMECCERRHRRICKIRKLWTNKLNRVEEAKYRNLAFSGLRKSELIIHQRRWNNVSNDGSAITQSTRV